MLSSKQIDIFILFFVWLLQAEQWLTLDKVSWSVSLGHGSLNLSLLWAVVQPRLDCLFTIDFVNSVLLRLLGWRLDYGLLNIIMPITLILRMLYGDLAVLLVWQACRVNEVWLLSVALSGAFKSWACGWPCVLLDQFDRCWGQLTHTFKWRK